jgi:2,3-diaminopropionate biosynthesis protein SbnA
MAVRIRDDSGQRNEYGGILLLDADGARTPVVCVSVRRDADVRPVLLKLEMANPTGSTKDRTARGILEAMNAAEPLRPGDVVVESTSGNLGLAMARLLTGMGCRFIAVTDLNTPEETRRRLAVAGAEVVVVDEPDGKGGYLLNRLRKVEALCSSNPGYRWSNQYGNPANPAAHASTTGPEIVAQGGPDLDRVYVAVSTGGTLAGVSRHLRIAVPRVRIVAVDAEGSLVTGTTPGRRLLSGIGASRPSSFLSPGDYDAATAVGDARSFAVCRMLRDDTGIWVGGSSGSVLSACLDDLHSGTPPHLPLCLLPDGGERYQNTFYDDDWLFEREVLDAVNQEQKGLREAGVAFEYEQRGESL